MLNLSTTTLRIGSVCYNIMPLFNRIVTDALPGSWTQHAMKAWTRDQLRGPNQEFICWAAPRAIQSPVPVPSAPLPGPGDKRGWEPTASGRSRENWAK